MKPSPFKLERFFAKYEFSAPYLLCSSDPESFSIEELLSLEPDSYESFKKNWLGYTETLGEPKLLEEISKLYKTITPKNILVHSGSQECIFNFMNSALEVSDHIIVHFPCYQSLFEIAVTIGCEVTKWIVREDKNWELDIDFLKKNIKKNTKAIIINCPHNPTGYLMSKEKLNEIVEIARKNNIFIFSDEVYRFLEHNEKDRLPAICDLYENGISSSSTSKGFGLPGLRIGWICTKNNELFNQMVSFKDYTSLCSSAPSSFLATLALKHKENIIKRNLQVIESNLGILNSFFKKYQDMFNWLLPKATTVAFPSIKLNIDIEKFCIDLAEKKGVFLLPSNVFDFGNKNFRIGFGRKNMTKCLEKLEEYLVDNYSKVSTLLK